jgi:hypothetical protein
MLGRMEAEGQLQAGVSYLDVSLRYLRSDRFWLENLPLSAFAPSETERQNGDGLPPHSSTACRSALAKRFA